MEHDQIHKVRNIKLGILFLGRKRPGFDPEWGQSVKGGIRSFLEEGGYDYFVPSENIADTVELKKAISCCRREGAKVLVVTQPTISDGRMAPFLAGEWQGPIVLWSTTEKQEGPMINANSLVGTHIFASILRQMHRPFEFIYGHPENASAPQILSEHHSLGHSTNGVVLAGGDDVKGLAPMRRQFEDSVLVAQAVHRLRTCAVGLIGYHAPGFINMAVHSSHISDRLGAKLYHDGLHAFFDMLPEVTEDRVSADVKAFTQLGLPYDERLTALDKKGEEGKIDATMTLASRIYLALKDYIAENDLDALAIRDWPEFPNVLGQWPYVAISRLASEGFALAPEGDVDGALGSLLAEELGMGPLYISDWLEHDNATAVLWHAGAAPVELCGPIGSKTGSRISVHFNNKKPAVIDGTVQADMPVTVFRLWQCDGEYKMSGFEAMTAKPYRPLYGNNCRVTVDAFSLGDWFENMLHEGMPHHVTLAPGHNLRKLRRLSRLLGLKWV